MPDTLKILEKLRELCLELPDAHETLTWGNPHFRVKDKIFAGFNAEADPPTVGMKLHKEDAVLLCASDPRFEKAPYVGKHGWVKMTLSGRIRWSDVREHVRTSYTLIAPKSSLKKLGAD